MSIREILQNNLDLEGIYFQRRFEEAEEYYADFNKRLNQAEKEIWGWFRAEVEKLKTMKTKTKIFRDINGKEFLENEYWVKLDDVLQITNKKEEL